MSEWGLHTAADDEPGYYDPEDDWEDPTQGGPKTLYRGIVVPSPVDLEGLTKSVGRNWTTDDEVSGNFSDPTEYKGVPSADPHGMRGGEGPFVGVHFEGEWDGDPDSVDHDWHRLHHTENEVRLKPGTPIRVKNVNYVYPWAGHDDENILTDGPRDFHASTDGILWGLHTAGYDDEYADSGNNDHSSLRRWEERGSTDPLYHAVGEDWSPGEPVWSLHELHGGDDEAMTAMDADHWGADNSPSPETFTHVHMTPSLAEAHDIANMQGRSRVLEIDPTLLHSSVGLGDEGYPAVHEQINPEAIRRVIPARPRTASHTDGIRYAAVVDADVAEDLRRLAMPAPLPADVTFHYHDDDSDVPRLNHYRPVNPEFDVAPEWEADPTDWVHRGHSGYRENELAGFPVPAVEARVGGKHAGYLSWNPDNNRVVQIQVFNPYTRQNIATSMWDHAKQINPALQHSNDRTPLGRQWIEHEESRHRTAMPDGARIHHVKPGAKPQPWNMTGSKGFVVPHAHVLGDVTDWAASLPPWPPRTARLAQILSVPPEELLQYANPGNRKRYPLAPLKRDLASQGMNTPVEVRANGGHAYIEDGHHRAWAAQQLGWDTVPVHVDWADWASIPGRSLVPGQIADWAARNRTGFARLAARPKKITPPWSDFHNGKAYPLQNQSTADLIHMLYSLRDAHRDGNPPADGVTPYADRIPHYEAELLDRHEAGDPEATQWADRGSYIKPDYMSDEQWQDNLRMYPEDYPIDPRPARRRKPTAAVTQDLVDRLKGEFHVWRRQQPQGSIFGGGIVGGLDQWTNIEKFLKDQYPAAHRGLGAGYEMAGPLLDGRPMQLDYMMPGPLEYSTPQPYETGPEAEAKHGYDPKEIAAAMLLLHNKSDRFRGDMSQQDQARLTDIAQKRYQMQRAYEQRNARLAMAWDEWSSQITPATAAGGPVKAGESCENCPQPNHPDGFKYVQRPGSNDRWNYSGGALMRYQIKHPDNSESYLAYGHYLDGDSKPYLGIHMISTDPNHQHQGVAESLIRKLYEDHPGVPIDPGGMTDAGKGLKTRLEERIPDARDMLRRRSRLAGLNGDLPENLSFQYHEPGFEPFGDVIQPNIPVSKHYPTVSAHDGDRMIGHIQWRADGHPRRNNEIWDLRVHPDYHRRGVATALFDWTTDKINPDLKHSTNLSDEGRAFAEHEVRRPLADERYEAWRNGQPMPKRFAGRNGDPPPMTFEPFDTMWSNGIMARHAEDGRPLAHLHWYPDGEIETIRVHPEMRGRDVGKEILKHAVMHPETYEAEGGIKPSNTLTPAGRAFAQSLGHNPPDEDVTPADTEEHWPWKAVQNYVPLNVPYTGQNEAEMSKYLEQPWTPPSTARTARHGRGGGWPVWWRGKHRPGVEFDKRWHPNHPQHIPAPWETK